MSIKSFTTQSQLCISKIDKQKKINLLDFNRQQLYEIFILLGERKFRVDQVMRWIYHYYCDDFNIMTNLNQQLLYKLTKYTEISAPKVIKEIHSIDGTIKWILSVDDQLIESVYIPEKDRATLCVSTQVGCALKCKFCYTAQQGFNRNLRVSEIIGQVWRVAKIISLKKTTKKPSITNIVMMGMGEPLLNLRNVVTSLQIMLDDFGFGLSKRKITLSTSGIVPALNKLNGVIDVVLAISLHAPNDNLRNDIVPINKKYNISMFLSAAKNYLATSNANHGRITVEYVLLDHINDHTYDAHELAMLLKNIPCKINLIPWNAFPNAPYKRSSNSRIDCFYKILIKHGFTTVIRKTRGDDINAACGQLSGKIIDRTNRSIKY